MLKRLTATIATISCCFNQLPAEAHVKWFLSRSESELLALPKPALFCSLRWDNGLIAVAFSLIILLLYRLNQRFAKHQINRYLSAVAVRYDQWVHLLIGISTGALLMYCAWSMTFISPNLHLHNCCTWVAQSEALIGASFFFGILARPSAACLLLLLLYSFAKFHFADCIDLLPMYGVALYILIAGRGKMSLDRLVPALSFSTLLTSGIACALLRVFVGFGFVLLGFDEKIVHPQLAFNLLQQHPTINFVAGFGITNDLFVLCSGFSEIALGTMILLGIFPRAAIVILAILFSITTSIFGKVELIGHLPYYSVFAALFLHGAGASFIYQPARAVEYRTPLSLPLKLKGYMPSWSR